MQSKRLKINPKFHSTSLSIVQFIQLQQSSRKKGPDSASVHQIHLSKFSCQIFMASPHGPSRCTQTATTKKNANNVRKRSHGKMCPKVPLMCSKLHSEIVKLCSHLIFLPPFLTFFSSPLANGCALPSHLFHKST